MVRPRNGLALITSLGAVVLVSVIIAGVFTLTASESRSSTNRTASFRATQLTEAGLAHAMALLRTSTLIADTSFTRLLTGFDNTVGTSDDGHMIGYAGLTSALDISDTGRVTAEGRYFVELIDDPADADGNAKTDMNNRIIARCRGVTNDGAVAEIDAILGPAPMPAVAVDGSLTLNGTPELLGPCGGAHANTTVSVAGTTTVTTAGLLTSTGSTSVSGTIVDTAGTSIPPVPNQPPIDIPTLNPLTYCATVEYDMQADGFIRRVSDATLYDASVPGGVFGFRFFSSGSGEYRGTGSEPPDGIYCVRSNLQINTMGTVGDPVKITFYVTGSVSLGGNPTIVRADSVRNVLILAAGDVQLSGTATGGGASLSGLIYAGAQCSVMGTTSVSGQLVCKDGSNPSGANALVATPQVGGNASITFDCADGSSILGNRRVLYWYPRIGN